MCIIHASLHEIGNKSSICWINTVFCMLWPWRRCSHRCLEGRVWWPRALRCIGARAHPNGWPSAVCGRLPHRGWGFVWRPL